VRKYQASLLSKRPSPGHRDKHSTIILGQEGGHRPGTLQPLFLFIECWTIWQTVESERVAMNDADVSFSQRNKDSPGQLV
jgi:hypothetical protein